MPERNRFRRLVRTWHHLLAERSGNVTITFALAIIPLFALAGAAVDYSRASAIRTAMQASADSAALAISKDAASLNAADVQSRAADYFNATFTRTDVSNLQVTATYSNTGGSSLTLGAKATMKTSFMGVVGISEMALGVNAVTNWGTGRLRVALVLDTTGSMNSSGKMTALKTATSNLLDQLKSAATNNGDVYVSIIPFSKNVNLDSANYNATWIDWTDWESEPAILVNSKPSNWDQIGPGSSCPFTNSTYGFRCISAPTSTTTVSSIPSSGTYAGYICPSTDTGQKISNKIGIIYNGCYTSTKHTRTVETGRYASCDGYSNCSCSGSGTSRVCTQTYYEHSWVVNDHSTWNGCVTDRGTSSGPSDDYDRKVTAPSSTAASQYPAEQNSYCPARSAGLSYDWTTMKSFVNDLYPQGATNQPIGLVWGWQSLVGGGPLTAPSKDANFTYHEAIVLMSDGLNTLDRWYGNGSSTNTSVDKRMYDSTDSGVGTCANIKAAGITIYTIHVNTDGDPKSTLLQNCASSSDKFWMITSANQLITVFENIGTSLSQLRIAK